MRTGSGRHISVLEIAQTVRAMMERDHEQLNATLTAIRTARALSPNDSLATWYKYLGISLDTHFKDMTGRPVPILPQGQVIHELI